jgi:excinuclease UvrABC nuclease subunit
MTEKQEIMDVILENCIEYEEPKYCGVYFLIYRNKVVYVGQSIDIKRRINDHVKKREIKFTHWYCQQYDSDVARTEKERYFIVLLKPKHNKEFNPDYNIM